MKRPSFKFYLFIVVSLLAALPVFGLSVWESARWEAFRADEADKLGLRLAQSVSRELSQLLDDNLLLVEALAQQVQARNTLDPAVLKPMVQAQHRTVPGFLTLAIADVKGISLVDHDIHGATTVGMNYSDRAYYRQLIRTQAPVLSDPVISKLHDRPIIVFAVPFKDPSGALRGYAFGTFDVSEVQKTVDRITRAEFPGRIYVMDRAGRALAHPEATARTALRDLSGLEAFRSPGSNSQLRTGVDEAGTPLRTAVTTMDKRGAGWTVVVGWKPSELRVQAAQTESGGALAALLALLVSLAAAFPLATWLTRPLSRIASAAAAVGEGDLTQKLSKGSWWEPRETHLLVDSFESMLNQLRDLLRSLRASKEEMIKTVGGLSQMMRAQTSLMERQTINLTELSTSARVVQEVSALSANRAEEVLVRAANADDLSAAGEHSVERSLQGLQEIRNQTNTIVTTIGALLERTLEIGEITERVKDLADQSNVVAFNAAIQAMRAGEYGRGFDVVAAEMRSLANRSIESTVRIREILSNAESAIRSTAATTEDGGRKIQRGMEQIQESGSHLKELSLIVEVNSEGTKEIASAVKQQYSGILEISRGLDALEEAMRDTTVVFAGAEKVAEGLLSASERISLQVDAFRVE